MTISNLATLPLAARGSGSAASAASNAVSASSVDASAEFDAAMAGLLTLGQAPNTAVAGATAQSTAPAHLTLDSLPRGGLEQASSGIIPAELSAPDPASVPPLAENVAAIPVPAVQSPTTVMGAPAGGLSRSDSEVTDAPADPAPAGTDAPAGSAPADSALADSAPAGMGAVAGVPLPAAPGISVPSPAGQPAVGRAIESGLEPGMTPGLELSLESSLTSAAPSAPARPTDAVGAPASVASPATAPATATATALAFAPVTVTAPAPISPPPAPAAAPALVAQVAGPIFSLASAGPGEHVITIAVTPDNLGPVTVRAHVGGDGIRMELFAPTDGGRDALRAILSDLRRDLAGASSGISTSLDLSSKNEPSGESGNRRDQRAPAAASAPPTEVERRLDPRDNPFNRTSRAADSTIDVLA